MMVLRYRVHRADTPNLAGLSRFGLRHLIVLATSVACILGLVPVAYYLLYGKEFVWNWPAVSFVMQTAAITAVAFLLYFLWNWRQRTRIGHIQVIAAYCASKQFLVPPTALAASFGLVAFSAFLVGIAISQHSSSPANHTFLGVLHPMTFLTGINLFSCLQLGVRWGYIMEFGTNGCKQALRFIGSRRVEVLQRGESACTLKLHRAYVQIVEIDFEDAPGFAQWLDQIGVDPFQEE
ncbi:MAG: hypothetical protein AAF394_07770 [Planctomycetota bacterium]